MTEQLVPDKTQMRRYLDRKLTQAQIVDAWEKKSGVRVSRSAIAMAIGRYGLESARPRPRYEDTLPWTVHNDHKNHNDARMLRLEGRRRLGYALTEREHRLLSDWLRLLDRSQAVVTYEPDTDQGFWWVERTDDDDDVIRRPKNSQRAG